MGMLATSAVRSTGGYSPTGVYSIEFFAIRDFTEVSLGEYFFLMGLTNLDQSYNYRMSAELTFGGSSVVDFGLGQSPISLQGMIWPFYEGAPIRKPTSSAIDPKNSFASDASGVASALGGGILNELEGLNPFKKAGYLDFIDLVYLMHEARDLNKAKDRMPSSSFAYPTGFDIKSAMGRNQIDFLNAEKTKMVFHDYDRDAHWEVIFAREGGFKISQSVKDPMSWYWSLNLIGIKDVSEPAKFRRPMIPDPKKMLRDIRNGLNNILEDLSQPLALISGITDLYQDIAKLAEDLKQDLNAFESLNKSYLQKISKSGGPLRKKTNQFLELVAQFTFPNETLPNFGAYDAPSTPITTETPPSEQIGSSIPPQITNNVYTQTTTDDREVDLATDQTVQDMYELLWLLAQLTTAISEANNQTLNQTFTYIIIGTGMTLESIASTYYGSPLKVNELIRDNGLLLVGLSSTEIVGLRIRVPSTTTISYRDTGVLDDKYLLDNKTPAQAQEITERWFFGEDLDLNETRDMTIFNGDLGTIAGVDALVDNLLDRMILPKGAIPAHPQLGAMPNPGTTPEDFLNLIIPNRILQDIRSDLGVETADITEFSINEDEFRYQIEVTPIGGFKTFKLLRKKRGIIQL